MKTSSRHLSILSVGSDGSLLASRNQIVRSGGYSLESCADSSSAYRRLSDGDFDLVLLCHSLEKGDRDDLTLKIKREKPSMIVLLVGDCEEISNADVTVNSFDGPETLLAVLGQLSTKGAA